MYVVDKGIKEGEEIVTHGKVNFHFRLNISDTLLLYPNISARSLFFCKIHKEIVSRLFLLYNQFLFVDRYAKNNDMN